MLTSVLIVMTLPILAGVSHTQENERTDQHRVGEAGEPDPPREPQETRHPGPTASPEAREEGVTGDWGGVRDQIREEGGLSLGGSYLAEWTSVLDGGVRDRTSFRNMFVLEADMDLSAWRWHGARVFFQYLSVNPEGGDRGGSNDTGDTQGISNIETRRHLDIISELWFEQVLFEDRLRLKIGKMDANQEYAFVGVAGDFANSSAGLSPTVFTMPTYPDPAMGVNLFGTVLKVQDAQVTLGYGLFDGAAAADGTETGRRGPSTFFNDRLSDDYFHIAQAEAAWDGLAGLFGFDRSRWLGEGRFSAGFWHHSGTFDTFSGGRATGVNGVYLTLEQQIGSWGEGRLDGFGQLGFTDESVSDVGTHAAFGAVATGMIPGRSTDSMGLYASLAVLSDEAGAGFDDDELVIEAYYRFDVIGSVFLQPSVQFIANPGGNAALDDAWVLGVRAGLRF